LFIPVLAILDLRAGSAWSELPRATRDEIFAYYRRLAAWFRQAALWVRSGRGAGEVLGGLPEPPVLADPGNLVAALATWHGLLHHDVGDILEEVGPQPQPVSAPAAGGALHAAR
jgi:hypothetical protein